MLFAEFFEIFLKNINFAFCVIFDFFRNFSSNIFHAFSNFKIAFKHFLTLSRPYLKAMRSKFMIIWGCVCIVCIVVVIFLLNLTINYYQISYKGQNIGYVRNVNTVNNAISSLQQQFISNSKVLDDLDNFTVSEIQTNNLFLSCFKSSEITDALVITAQSIDYAYGVYVNGENLIFSASQNTVENTINDYKNDRIQLSPDILDKNSDCDVEWLVSLETKKECIPVEQITYSEIYITLYEKLEQNLPYRITCVQTVDESIPYMTQYERNTYLYSGSKKVIQKGKQGVKAVTTKVVVENGQLISNNILKEEITKNPVTRKVQIGSAFNDFSDASKVLLPVEGYLTSGFGMRKDPFTGEPAHHNGLDIAAATGTDIWAASQGKVIKASDTGNGYGKCVIIEHYDGFRTLYGHCSELLVSVGDYVKAGDLIAKVGSTGRSTGPHLHFSVIIDEKYVDPSIYF